MWLDLGLNPGLPEPLANTLLIDAYYVNKWKLYITVDQYSARTKYHGIMANVPGHIIVTKFKL